MRLLFEIYFASSIFLAGTYYGMDGDKEGVAVLFLFGPILFVLDMSGGFFVSVVKSIKTKIKRKK